MIIILMTIWILFPILIMYIDKRNPKLTFDILNKLPESITKDGEVYFLNSNLKTEISYKSVEGKILHREEGILFSEVLLNMLSWYDKIN